MDTFIGIRFKKETAKRFQKFSRTHFKTHTEAMEAILDFFFFNEISPKENLGPTGRTIEAKLLKRINAVIAIMRDVEKTQTKPTVAMLQSLFEMEEPEKKPFNGFMKDYVVRECINVLRREDVKEEVKSFVRPLLSMFLEQLYPYIYLCLFLVILSFLLVLGTFVLLIKNKTISFRIM